MGRRGQRARPGAPHPPLCPATHPPGPNVPSQHMKGGRACVRIPSLGVDGTSFGREVGGIRWGGTTTTAAAATTTTTTTTTTYLCAFQPPLTTVTHKLLPLLFLAHHTRHFFHVPDVHPHSIPVCVYACMYMVGVRVIRSESNTSSSSSSRSSEDRTYPLYTRCTVVALSL